jgi:hypothetical protein
MTEAIEILKAYRLLLIKKQDGKGEKVVDQCIKRLRRAVK